MFTKVAVLGLGKVGRDDPVKSAVEEGWTADQVGEAVFERFSRLIAAYDDPTRPYQSLAHPQFERRFAGDYDHLARIAEWRLADAGEGGG